MAKKSRRARRRSRKRKAPKPMPRQKAVLTPKKAVPASKPSQEIRVDLSEEYRYVYSDLKRTAILAGAMFAVLIILSFLIK